MLPAPVPLDCQYDRSSRPYGSCIVDCRIFSGQLRLAVGVRPRLSCLGALGHEKGMRRRLSDGKGQFRSRPFRWLAARH